MIDGVKVIPLRQIVDESSKIMHMGKATDPDFINFGLSVPKVLPVVQSTVFMSIVDVNVKKKSDGRDSACATA